MIYSLFYFAAPFSIVIIIYYIVGYMYWRFSNRFCQKIVPDEYMYFENLFYINFS